MADHAEQLVGTLFRVLSEEGHEETQQALLKAYQSQATTEREELTQDLFSDLLTVLHRQLDTEAQVDILTTAVERLLNRFTAVVEAAPVAILVVDADGMVQVWNNGAERIFGWTDTEVRRQMYPQVLSSSSGTTEEILPRLQNNEQLHGVEARHTHKNGSVLDVRIWAAPVQTQDEEFSGAVLIISDITDQKQREQRLTVLNRVLRHNIRNDVNVIQGRLEMLVDDLSIENEHTDIINKHLSNIIELSQTARNIEQLQDDSEAERTTVDLGVMLRKRVEQLRIKSQNSHISDEIPESLSVVAHELLPYAFDNILDNAIEHNDSEIPRVTVAVEVGPSQNHVTVSVADNGPGLPSIEQEVLTSETETSLSHSSGLGLWLTRWIVRSSGGSITVRESEFGGTCVSVRLRAQSEPTAASSLNG
ncbi:PAS domain S-box protein [Halorubrum sp. DM2]|uniref:PAS domain S-box protein n=1 Tax=Halorubrum sp. DM2 TaxID=2527867 RepID=UPI0024B82845|nr:PAS domain S-box protein [Halorubrum sp. DM2]